MRAVEERDRIDSLAEALFHPTGVDGVYGRSGIYENVVDAD